MAAPSARCPRSRRASPRARAVCLHIHHEAGLGLPARMTPTPDANTRAIHGLQTLAVALVALTLLVCIALAVWSLYRKRSPNNAFHAVLTVLTCGFWAPTWIIVAVFRGRGAGTGVSITRYVPRPRSVGRSSYVQLIASRQSEHVR